MSFLGGEGFLCCRRTERGALWTRWDHHHVHHSSSQPGQKEDDLWTKLASAEPSQTLYAKYLCSPKETSLHQQPCLTLTQHQGLFSHFFYLFFFSQQTFQTLSRWLEDKYL